MSPTIEEQIEKLKSTIAEMEAQRELLGDEVTEQALLPLRKKLEALNRELEASKVSTLEKPPQQRKLVTLLFMDIVGSTSIIQHMDPEDASEIFDENLKRLAQPVEDYSGRVTRFMGDGFMALFGAPTAREDDPERAVRAGLVILQRAEELAKELGQERGVQDFRVRVGINTGLIVLGGETEGADTTTGPTVHLAARLQGAAPPGGLLISHDTYRHIRGVFDVQPWEPIQVKGFDEPVLVYHVLRARPRAFHAYTRGVEGLETRMVGRNAELKYLQDSLLFAIEAGEGQVITIIGEAGVGKSRLLYEFQNWIELQATSVRFYEGRAHQESQGMPYAMLRNLFEFRFQLQENDALEAVRQKVEAGFLEVFGRGDEGQMRAHILGQWLGFDFSSSPALRGVLADAEQLRNRGMMYLGEYFIGMCSQAPVIVFLEDIHWADDSSLDALSALGERLQHKPLLIVCNARNSLLERRPYWGEGLEYHHCIELEPLSRRESHQLVREIFKLAENVPTALTELVVEGAEGNPFYLEELVKMLVEDGVVVKGEDAWQVIPGRLSEIKVPPTLAGVLQARLESLPAQEQQVLQQASVVGRLFWDQVVEHIQAAEGGKPQAVPAALVSLRGKEMIYRREVSVFNEASEYLFKHDILREVTYESVLKRLRKKYHGLVADWLIAQVGERGTEYSGLISRHLLQADRKDQAVEYLIKAGQAALSSYANVEAEDYLHQALSLTLADDQKAACLAGLGESLRRQGQNKEAAEALRKSIEISVPLGESDKVAGLYSRLAEVVWRINRLESYEICQEGLRRLDSAADGPGMARLLAETGRTAHFQDRPKDEVIALCQRAIEMDERQGELEAKVHALNTIALVTTNFEEERQLLNDVAASCEANGLWYQAGRACHNLAVAYTSSFSDDATEIARQLFMKAVAFNKKVGDVEGLLFTSFSLANTLMIQGKLRTVEERMKEILYDSPASHTRIDEFMQDLHSRQHYFRGEWLQMLSYHREQVIKKQKEDDLEGLGGAYFGIAHAILELNTFQNMADFSEAEDALRKTLKSEQFAYFSYCLLATLSARQGRIGEARQYLTGRLEEAVKDQNLAADDYLLFFHIRSEAEIEIAEEHWDEAISKYRELIKIDQKIGDFNNTARQLINLGDALVSRDQPGDGEEAERAYRQSVEMYREMGAPGYIQALEERLKKLTGGSK